MVGSSQGLTVMVLALGIFTGGGMFTSAATYTAYVLKPLGGNNYTYWHVKQTKTNFIANKVTAFTNASSANFWAQYDGGAILGTQTASRKYTQKVNSTYTTINMLLSVDAGKRMRLAMENANLSTSNAFVSGNVEFF